MLQPLPGERERLLPRLERTARDFEVEIRRAQVDVRRRHVADQ